jgi:hypothetical protein
MKDRPKFWFSDSKSVRIRNNWQCYLHDLWMLLSNGQIQSISMAKFAGANRSPKPLSFGGHPSIRMGSRAECHPHHHKD